MTSVSWEGLSLTRYNERRNSFDHYYKIKGFETLEQANEYKARIMNSWGYCPIASVEQIDGDIIVSCSLMNSCD
jgi:hypothetical protein